jgi:hypothetical protein
MRLQVDSGLPVSFSFNSILFYRENASRRESNQDRSIAAGAQFPLAANFAESVSAHFELITQSMQKIAWDFVISVRFDLASDFVGDFALMAVAYKTVGSVWALQLA